MHERRQTTPQEIDVPVSASPTILIDTERRFLSVDAAMLRLCGYGADELRGAYQDVVIHPDTPRAVLDDMWDTLDAGRPWCGVLKHVSRDGGHFWLALSIVPIRAASRITAFKCVGARALRLHVKRAEETYRRLREGGAADFAFVNGRLVSERKPARVWRSFCSMPLRYRLGAGAACGIASAAMLAFWPGAVGSGTPTPLFLTLALGAGAASLGAWAMERRLARRLDSARAAIAAMAAGDFHARIDWDANDEIAELFQSLKVLQIRLGFDDPTDGEELRGRRTCSDEAGQQWKAYDMRRDEGVARWPGATGDVLGQLETVAFRTRLLALNLALSEQREEPSSDCPPGREAREVAKLAADAVDALRRRLGSLANERAARSGTLMGVQSDVIPAVRGNEAFTPGEEAYDVAPDVDRGSSIALAGCANGSRLRLVSREVGAPLPKVGCKGSSLRSLRDEWEEGGK